MKAEIWRQQKKKCFHQGNEHLTSTVLFLSKPNSIEASLVTASYAILTIIIVDYFDLQIELVLV